MVTEKEIVRAVRKGIRSDELRGPEWLIFSEVALISIGIGAYFGIWWIGFLSFFLILGLFWIPKVAKVLSISLSFIISILLGSLVTDGYSKFWMGYVGFALLFLFCWWMFYFFHQIGLKVLQETVEEY